MFGGLEVWEGAGMVMLSAFRSTSASASLRTLRETPTERLRWFDKLTMTLDSALCSLRSFAAFFRLVFRWRTGRNGMLISRYETGDLRPARRRHGPAD